MTSLRVNRGNSDKGEAPSDPASDGPLCKPDLAMPV
jgi:hypothetical protein